MCDERIPLSLPLDGDGFLRRECPYCLREFKIHIAESELTDLVQRGVDSFLLAQQPSPDQDEDSELPFADQRLFTCPYCGEEAPADSWWTQEQLAYIRVVMKNVVDRMINEHLIRPWRRKFGSRSSGSVSISFEGKDLPMSDEWISPEADDMVIQDLPCCSQRLKVSEGWKSGIRCFFCGFPFSRTGMP